MVDIHVQAHADGVGGHQEIDLAGLVEGDLGVAGAGAERAHHHRRAAALAADQLGDGVDRVGGEGDDGGTAGKAGELLRAGVGQAGKALPRLELGVGGQAADQRRHGVRAQQHGLRKTPGVQQPMGEDMAPLRIGGELDLVDRQELDLPVQWHGLDGADEILRPGRDDLFLAGDQGDRAGSAGLDDAVVNLPRQQAQRQADHAGLVAQHPLDREMGLASVGRAQDSLELRRRAAGGAVAHGHKVGDSRLSDKRGEACARLISVERTGRVKGSLRTAEQARNKPCPNQ